MSEEKDYLGWILGGGLILMIVLGCGALVLIKQQGSKCLGNPPQFAVNKIANANGQNFVATYTSLGGTYKTPLYYSSNISFKN